MTFYELAKKRSAFTGRDPNIEYKYTLQQISMALQRENAKMLTAHMVRPAPPEAEDEDVRGGYPLSSPKKPLSLRGILLLCLVCNITNITVTSQVFHSFFTEICIRVFPKRKFSFPPINPLSVEIPLGVNFVAGHEYRCPRSAGDVTMAVGGSRS
jgi:hypothetical protein